jgi:hypothetical protein
LAFSSVGGRFSISLPRFRCTMMTIGVFIPTTVPISRASPARVRPLSGLRVRLGFHRHSGRSRGAPSESNRISVRNESTRVGTLAGIGAKRR